MTTHIDTFTAFVADQMDGAQVPPHNSKELNRLSEAVTAIQKGGDHDLQIMALRVMNAVIDRVRSGIGAEQTLRTFLTGGENA